MCIYINIVFSVKKSFSKGILGEGCDKRVRGRNLVYIGGAYTFHITLEGDIILTLEKANNNLSRLWLGTQSLLREFFFGKNVYKDVKRVYGYGWSERGVVNVN